MTLPSIAPLDRRGGRRRAAVRRRPTPRPIVALFILPSLSLYLLFMVMPFLGTIRLSLSSWDGFQPVQDFIGLDNFLRLVQDEAFLSALRNNLIWAVIGTAAPILLALPLAVILWSGSWGRNFFRVVFFLPVILPAVVAGLVWGWIYHPLFGPLNTGLTAIGLGDWAQGWLGNEETALFAVLVAAIWGTFGFVVVMFLAGLQGVDSDLVDASVVDGANARQRLWYVLLPAIAPVFTFVLTITLVGAFSVFDIIYVMTRGGPGTATEVIAGYAFRVGFGRNDQGYGAAVAMVIAVISLVLALLLLRLRERNRLYD
jgi:ABC-type sugar transport system permease subunit